MTNCNASEVDVKSLQRGPGKPSLKGEIGAAGARPGARVGGRTVARGVGRDTAERAIGLAAVARGGVAIVALLADADEAIAAARRGARARSAELAAPAAGAVRFGGSGDTHAPAARLYAVTWIAIIARRGARASGCPRVGVVIAAASCDGDRQHNNERR